MRTRIEGLAGLSEYVAEQCKRLRELAVCREQQCSECGRTLGTLQERVAGLCDWDVMESVFTPAAARKSVRFAA